MNNESNILRTVCSCIPEDALVELAVKCKYYKNEEGFLIYRTGNFDDQEEIDGQKDDFDLMKFFEAGRFKERIVLKFDKLVLDGREHLFINAVGSHLQTHIQDLTHKIEDLQRQLKSQANSYEAKIKEWRDNHKQLTTAYNELHYEYRQFKKSVNEKEMDSTEKKVEEVGERR